MEIPTITEQELLERVDEYSLFCFYLEFQPVIGAKYKSRLRVAKTDSRDDFASFGIFERKAVKKFGETDYANEYMWKDQGLPGRNYGDIFDLVCRLYGLPHRLNALWKIAGDFGLIDGYEVKRLAVVPPTSTPPTFIQIQSREFNARDLAYWAKYNITPEILKQYNTTAVKYYKLTEFQEHPTAPSQCYAYRIGTRYQLYQPFVSKDNKFRNNWTEEDIPGWHQQEGTDLCVITKSYKDVMSLRAFGYNAISPRGENIVLPEQAIRVLQQRYRKVLMLFDNDEKHSAGAYPFDAVFIPIESGTKDPTDYCAKYGPVETSKLLKRLIDDYRRE